MKAIDVHTHPATAEYLLGSFGPIFERTSQHFRHQISVLTPDEMAEEYRSQGLKAVLSAWDAETTTGYPKTSNDHVAEIVKKHPGLYVGWASVDPWKGVEAIRELERAIKELGMRGAGEFHPIMQAFYPNDRKLYPLWEKCLELSIPVSFHTGTTGVGAGTPGGGGYKINYSHPRYIDELAADFPNLTIGACHPSIPWQDEMLAVAVHKGNVYLDLSGWSPKYFSPNLIRHINGPLKERCVFGTDYPWIKPEKWLADFAQLDIKDEARPKVLYENAIRILKLDFWQGETNLGSPPG